MRLKGGKVLLDLTGYGDINSNDIQHQLLPEESKSIQEKGVTIKVLFKGLIIVTDLIVTNVSSTTIVYNPFDTGISPALNTSNNIFEIVDNR